jgi:hypothetical protein
LTVAGLGATAEVMHVGGGMSRGTCVTVPRAIVKARDNPAPIVRLADKLVRREKPTLLAGMARA